MKLKPTITPRLADSVKSRVVAPDWIRPVVRQAESIEIGNALIAQIGPSTLCKEALQLLVALIRDRRPAWVLELGGGLSTAVLASELDALPEARLLSCDHSSHYLAATRERIGDHPRVRLFHAPLEGCRLVGKRFVTYGGGFDAAVAGGGPYDVVVIDGPPGYEFGREGALYRIAPYLSPSALILLDDAGREPERRAVQGWKRVWGERLSVIHYSACKKGFGVLMLEQAHRMATPGFGLIERVRGYKAFRRAMASPNLRGEPA